MYKGIKRKPRKKFRINFPTKFQMITQDETIVNGIIQNQYKVKTIDLQADPNIHWFDFEVNNLLAAGIDVRNQAPVTMGVNKETLADNANAAQETMDIAELINELEQERTNNNQ